MNKKNKYIITILSLIILVTLAITITIFSKQIKCKILENEINQLLETANHCTTNTDCDVNTQSSCPFGCYNLINKNTKIDEIIKKRIF
jgi:uncharacterized membrane protein